MFLDSSFYYAIFSIRATFFFLFFITMLGAVIAVYTLVYKRTFRTPFTLPAVTSNLVIACGFPTLILTFLISFFIYLKVYLNLIKHALVTPLVLFQSASIFKFSFVEIGFNLFSYVIIFLALFIGLFALLASENKLHYKNINFFFYFNYFLLIVYLFVGVKDVVLLFICYELLLIPSILFLYFVSYTKKAVQASLYFAVWTQLGSLLVLCAVAYLVSIVGESSFAAIRLFKFRYHESITIYVLLFFGFGFKFPIWPFHYWLTKTHVEASSGFSIYLSGFLVKSALFGFYTITNLLTTEFNTIIFGVFAFLGAIDASLKLWGQSDLKKLVAYCTIQEMNLIVLTFLFGDSRILLVGILFSAAHGFLSSLMFFLVDCIYRRVHSRSVYQVSGLLHRTPNLGTAIFVMCVLYAGLPGTIKFVCEFLVFGALVESSMLSAALLLFIVNVLGIIGFTKPWFNVIFGMPGSDLKYPIMDLSRREIYMIVYPIFFFFFFTYIAFPLL